MALNGINHIVLLHIRVHTHTKIYVYELIVGTHAYVYYVLTMYCYSASNCNRQHSNCSTIITTASTTMATNQSTRTQSKRTVCNSAIIKRMRPSAK